MNNDLDLSWPIEFVVAYCIGVVLVAAAIAWLMDWAGKQKGE